MAEKSQEKKNSKNKVDIKQKVKDIVKPKVKKDSVASLKKDIKSIEDKHIRLKAEFENFRKRKTKEFSEILRYDGQDLIKQFFPIADDLNRIIDAGTDNRKDPVFIGVEMINSKINKFFDKNEIISFAEPGEELDSSLHDAMMTKTNKDFKNNTILEVFEKGYKYHDKVLRHAKVIVNKI